MEIKYHLDESVPRAIAVGLLARGIDATTPADVGLLEASDAAQISFAARENRVLFSHDDDFLRLASQGCEHAGIVYCHQRTRSIGQIVQGLVRLWRERPAEQMKNRVTFL